MRRKSILKVENKNQRRSSTVPRGRVQKRNVSFDMIQIREYPYILGDNPAVSEGAPLQIDWKYFNEEVNDVEMYEFMREPNRKEYRKQLVMSVQKRAKILCRANYDLEDIAKATMDVVHARQQRKESVKDVISEGFTGNIADIISGAAEATGRSLKTVMLLPTAGVIKGTGMVVGGVGNVTGSVVNGVLTGTTAVATGTGNLVIGTGKLATSAVVLTGKTSLDVVKGTGNLAIGGIRGTGNLLRNSGRQVGRLFRGEKGEVRKGELAHNIASRARKNSLLNSSTHLEDSSESSDDDDEVVRRESEIKAMMAAMNTKAIQNMMDEAVVSSSSDSSEDTEPSESDEVDEDPWAMGFYADLSPSQVPKDKVKDAPQACTL